MIYVVMILPNLTMFAAAVSSAGEILIEPF